MPVMINALSFFRAKGRDTKAATVEKTNKINPNARCDMLLNNLLAERGFDSLTQMLLTYCGRLKKTVRRRRLFLSFRAEDMKQVRDFRLMAKSPKLDLVLFERGLSVGGNGENGSFIRPCLPEKIRLASVFVFLIDNGTTWREWVDWEIQTAYDFGKKACGVRLEDSCGRRSPLLVERNAPLAAWKARQIIAVIQCAAAHRR